MPTLHDTCSSAPSTACGSRMRGISRCSTTSAISSTVCTPPSTTTNSSPPRRLTVSPSRTPSASRRATDRSRPSPMWWPSESLICLKRSRSMNSTATRCCVRRACCTASRNRSMHRLRLGSSVSTSCSARKRMRCSLFLRSLMSIEVKMQCDTSPALRRLPPPSGDAPCWRTALTTSQAGYSLPTRRRTTTSPCQLPRCITLCHSASGRPALPPSIRPGGSPSTSCSS